MGTPESELVKLIDGVDETTVGLYRELMRAGTGVMQIVRRGDGFIRDGTVDINGETDNFGRFFETQWTIQRFTEALEVAGKQGGVAMAALIDLMVTQLGRAEPLQMSPKSPEGIIDYVPREMRGETEDFIRTGMSLLSELKPPIEGKITKVSLKDYGDLRRELVKETDGEFLIVTGLNGAGKTTVLQFLLNFGEQISVFVDTVKFPRENGFMGKELIEALQGAKIERRVLQMMFLADQLEWVSQTVGMKGLWLADRLPAIEGAIFSPQFTKTISLASLESLPMPVTVIIVDRHQLSCMEAIKVRSGDPRIFERDSGEMTRHRVSYWALTKIPGVFLANVEGKGENLNRDLLSAGMRVIDATVNSGVWARQLVRLGKFDDFVTAQNWVMDQSWDWYWSRSKQA